MGLSSGLKTIWISTLFLSQSSFASFKVHCVGARNARRHMVFLRGITPELGPREDLHLERWRSWPRTMLADGVFFQKEYYEKMFDEMGRSLGIAFALIESDQYCPGSLNNFCWTGNEPASIAATYNEVIHATSKCFEIQPRKFDILGFSNGGYHVGRAVMLCLAPQPDRAFMFGAAGDIKLAVSSDLSRCASQITVAIGDQDITNASARKYSKQMASRKIPTRFFEFFGGHELPENVVRTLIK